MRPIPRVLASLAAVALLAAGCGDDDDTSAGADGSGESRPTVVVTTNILGDVVTNLAGDAVDVVTIMPVGADPHDFQASAQQANTMRTADALIVNGEGFEEGLIDVIAGAESDGVATFAAISAVSTIEFGESGHSDHDDHDDEEGHDDHDDEDDHDHEGEEGHDDEDDHDHEGEESHDDEDDHDHEGEEGHDDADKDEDDHDHEDEESHDEHEGDEGHDDHDEHGHDHDGADPHFFTDPARMAQVVPAIADFLIDNVEGLDAAAVEAAAADYTQQLEDLDGEVAALVDGIPAENRVLVTNHEVFGYFADRYGFEVVGTVIPSGSTLDGTSAGGLAELAEAIEAEGVPAIFSDTSSSDELVQTLADEVGEIAVVELYTESLGEAGSDGATYLSMVRTNAERIAAALGG